MALLALAGLAVAASLVFKPPRSVPRAVLLLAGAMTLMFVLAPSTRFGYFIYPGGAGHLAVRGVGRPQGGRGELGEIPVDSCQLAYQRAHQPRDAASGRM